MAASRSCRSATGRPPPGTPDSTGRASPDGRSGSPRPSHAGAHMERSARGVPGAGAERAATRTRWRWTCSGSAPWRTCCSPASRRRPPGASCWPGWPRRTGCARRRSPTRSRSSWTSWCRRRPRRCRPQRLATVAEFLELLETRRGGVHRPAGGHRHPPEPEPEPVDLLEARRGDVVGEWRIKQAARHRVDLPGVPGARTSAPARRRC